MGIVDLTDMIARTPGGAMGIFVIVPVVMAVVVGVGTKNPGAALAAMALGMAGSILLLELSPWLFVMVISTALGSVGLLIQMGWRGR